MPMATTTNDDLPEIPPSGGSGAWAEVGAGSYNATIATIEDTGVSSMFPESGPQLKIGFALDDGLDEFGQPVVLNRWVSQKWNEKSNLFKVALACGLDPDPGAPFRVSGLMGGKLQVVVEIKNAGTPQERPGISTFLPRQKARGKAAPAAKVAEAGDTCAVGGCGKAVDHYTAKGTPFCGAHSPEDL